MGRAENPPFFYCCLLLLCLRWRRRLRHCELLIGAEQAHFYASVLGPRRSIPSLVCRFFFPQSDLLDAEHRDVMLRNQVCCHVLRSPTAQLVVVLGRPGLVGEALDGNVVTLSAGMFAHELV